MDTVLDILQALGIGAAVGIRPFLPALLVAALAVGDLGVDFEGTDWSFLEATWFLVVVLAGAVVSYLLRAQPGIERYVVQAAAVALGAVLGAGSAADHGGPVVVGLLVGAAAAVLALAAIGPVFERVRTRLGAEAGLLPLYREALALAAAGLSVLFPPLALVVVGALLFLLAGGRRREGEKYAGLRILR